MAENRSLQSVYTMEGVYATANSQNEVVNYHKNEDMPAILKVRFGIFTKNMRLSGFPVIFLRKLM